MIRCKDKKHGESVFGSEWCAHAKDFGQAQRAEKPLLGTYPDMRCANWLRVCEKTGKVVVHNKKCDAV
jgi:hypothetical protein